MYRRSFFIIEVSDMTIADLHHCTRPLEVMRAMHFLFVCECPSL
jgi:hypothetical protein